MGFGPTSGEGWTRKWYDDPADMWGFPEIREPFFGGPYAISALAFRTFADVTGLHLGPLLESHSSNSLCSFSLMVLQGTKAPIGITHCLCGVPTKDSIAHAEKLLLFLCYYPMRLSTLSCIVGNAG